MRAETGPMKFKDDWTGIFIRGDNAYAYANYLYQFLHTPGNDPTRELYKKLLENLIELLNQSNEHRQIKDDDMKTQNLKSFQECIE